MALKHTALWISLAATSAVVQAQPIDQPREVTQTIDRTAQFEFDEMLARQITDLNADEFPDMIWANATGSNIDSGSGIYKAYGDGMGGFGAPIMLYDDDPAAPRVANNPLMTITSPDLDFNQDGIQDYVSKFGNPSVSSAVSRITFFVSNPAMSTMEEYTFPEVPLTSSDYHLHGFTDIDANGEAELITLGGEYTGGHYNAKLKTFNVTQDNNGNPTDITVQQEHIFTFSSGASAFYLKLEDLNGDDKLDAVFVVLNDTDTTNIDAYDKTYADLVVYYQEDNLTWSSPSTIKSDMIFYEYGTVQYLMSDVDIEAADLDGNGRKDIVTFNTGLINGDTMTLDRPANIAVFWQETDGTFSESELTKNYFWDISYPGEIQLHDIDSDGTLDIAYHGIVVDMANFQFIGQYVWQRNLGNRAFSDIYYLSAADEYLLPEGSNVTDMNNDAQTDLLMYGTKVTDLQNGTGPSGLFYINPDIFPPEASISAPSVTHQYDAFTLTINTNEAVTDLTASDVLVTGGSISNWQAVTPGSEYQVTVTPTDASSTVVATINAEQFVDASNISNRSAATLTVAANVRPQITTPDDIELRSGNPLNLTAVVSDPDSTEFSFELLNAPQWLTIDDSSGILSGTPTDDDIATYNNIQIRVSDGTTLNGSAYETSAPFSISVVANNPDADGDGVLDDLESGDYNGDGIDDSQQSDPGIESAIGGGTMHGWMMLLLLPLALVSQLARADNPFKHIDWNNAYAGLITGKSYLTPDDSNSGWKQQNNWHTNLGVNVGYQFHDDAFAEFNYQNLGEANFANNNPNISGSPTLRYSASSLLAGYYLNEQPGYRAYVRAGLSELKTRSSARLNNQQQSDLVIPFGAGIEMVLEPNWNLRVGADYFSNDVQNFYLNLKYQH